MGEKTEEKIELFVTILKIQMGVGGGDDIHSGNLYTYVLQNLIKLMGS